VARAGEVASIGIDAEPHEALPAGILERVTVPPERAHLAGLPPPELLLLLPPPPPPPLLSLPPQAATTSVHNDTAIAAPKPKRPLMRPLLQGPTLLGL